MSFTHQPVSQRTRISEAGFPRKGSHKGCPYNWGPSLYQYPHMRLSCAMTRIDLIFPSHSFIITVIARDKIRVHPCDWKATALHNPISLAFYFLSSCFYPKLPGSSPRATTSLSTSPFSIQAFPIRKSPIFHNFYD